MIYMQDPTQEDSSHTLVTRLHRPSTSHLLISISIGNRHRRSFYPAGISRSGFKLLSSMTGETGPCIIISSDVLDTYE